MTSRGELHEVLGERLPTAGTDRWSAVPLTAAVPAVRGLPGGGCGRLGPGGCGRPARRVPR
ncbi:MULTISPECIES: hypothetical protein [Streptomyces]|uniref:hypothetical protein n=1 Tax=Streptomyces TaxID=1883 RepID=UPI0002DA4030|nr:MULTISPECIES: hypothetical protein [Streptomyces]MYS92007.1 hypothetical protein [Streptomyces sp. SID5464]